MKRNSSEFTDQNTALPNGRDDNNEADQAPSNDLLDVALQGIIARWQAEPNSRPNYQFGRLNDVINRSGQSGHDDDDYDYVNNSSSSGLHK